MTPTLPMLVTSRLLRARSATGLVLCAGLLALQAGCRPAARESSESSSRPAASQANAQPAQAASVDRELWDACYVQGNKVGYQRTTFSRIERDGQPLVRIEGLLHLTIKRFEDVTESENRSTSIETPDGKVLEFEDQMGGSGTPMVSRGRVNGDRLEIQTETRGKSVTTTIPWPPDCGGYFAVEQSLERKPMQPGERRKLRALVCALNVVASVDLAARDFETVKLLSGSYDLLRIDSVVELPGGKTIAETLWADRTGTVGRRRSEALNIESFRVPKAVALEKSEGGKFDLGKDLSVAVEREIPSPHDTKRITYRVTLDGGDPAGTFVSCDSQKVRSLDPHTAEVTVYAVRPGGPPGNADAPPDPPTKDDSSPNSFIQSDNPKIVAIAAEAAGQEKDPWKVAVALEARTRTLITKRDYSQAFASAAEVVETGVGDCTEHAVLLAALARARGIPARVAIGLVYVHEAGKGMFAYHMWDELYLGTRWIPMDSTLAKGGIGAAHLKIAHTSLQGASAFSTFLPVANIAGRLKIVVERVE